VEYDPVKVKLCCYGRSKIDSVGLADFHVLARPVRDLGNDRQDRRNNSLLASGCSFEL
jgi:hypothetical protein